MTFKMLLTSAITVVALVGAPAIALADGYTYTPNALTPVDPSPPGKATTGVTTAGVPSVGDYKCAVIANVQAEPSGFVLGNCLTGWHLHNTDFSIDNFGNNWLGGEITGDYSGCGWILGTSLGNVLNNNAYSACYPASVPQSAYMYHTASGYFYDGCGGTPSCSGTLFNHAHSCPEYLNYRPWSASTSREIDPIRSDPPNPAPQPRRLAWRYLAAFASTDGTGGYYMVRDTTVAPGSGNWVFIPASCI